MFTFSLCPTTKLYIKNWFVKFAAFNYRFSFNNILFGPEMSSSCLIFSHSILQITFFCCCSYLLLFVQVFHMQLVSWMFVGQFGPSNFKVFAHTMTGLSNGRIILIEYFTIVKYQSNVSNKIVTGLVSEFQKKRVQIKTLPNWVFSFRLATLTPNPGCVSWSSIGPLGILWFSCKWEIVSCWRATEKATNLHEAIWWENKFFF